MYKRLSLSKKHTLIKRVQAGANLAKLCREEGISRTVLYKWVKAYEKAGVRAKKSVLTSHTATGKSHWKALSSTKKRTIINSAIKQPDATPAQIAKKAGVSIHGVWNVLKRENLNTKASRTAYVHKNGQNLIATLPHAVKVLLMARLENGEKVSKLSRELGVSRTTIYKWVRKYDEARKDEKALAVSRPRAEKHWRHIMGMEEIVLGVIVRNPTLSLNQLVEYAKKQDARLGRHAIYAFLRRLGLSTYQKRVAYANSQKISISQFPQADQVSLPRAPRYSFSSFLSPPFVTEFSKLKLFFFYSGTTFVATLLFLLVGTTIAEASGILAKIGMAFAFLSLFCGMFFFVYSLKSYITIAFVLSYSRRIQDNAGHFIKRSWWQAFLADVFGVELTIEQESNHSDPVVVNKEASGLVSDMSGVALESYPFISVHVSIYNEKRVIDRLLTACTSFDYPNYEVVVADDSTDETYDLIKKWENHPRVKISHRENRDGYKGQALQQALRVTDPRAQFIAVFDADFIPYPDSLTQFLKYMQQSVGSLDPKVLAGSNVAAVQGYQWHVLNKSENWVTRGIRTEYAGSYVIERSGEEIYHGLKQISGSVYMVRRDVLQKLGWGRSITEDFQFTLRLYEAGYKVVYTPYIQAPAEAASTIKRLIRQRMRWSEGHSYNVRKMFKRLLFGHFSRIDEQGNGQDWVPSPLTKAEKLEFIYLAPYYLQAALFIVGTVAWFLAETVFQVRLPFWTEVLGWSLVLTNLFALPLMNMVGLFMEETEEKDYIGLFSFVALSYIVAPFQAYAAIKGFIEKEEGPWFRTPKTGRITDTFLPGKVYRLVKGWFGAKTAVSKQVAAPALPESYLALATSHNTFDGFSIKKKRARSVGNAMLGVLLIALILISGIAPYIPATQQVYASQKVMSVEEAKKEQDAQVEKAKSGEVDPGSQLGNDKGADLLRNFQTEEISTPRIVTKKTKGDKQVSFVFHKEPRVRILFDKHEIDVTAQHIAGKQIRASKATIYKDKEVIYHEILKDVDLKYSIGNDMISEEYIIKTPQAARYFSKERNRITSQMKVVGIKVVSVDNATFGLYDKENKEIFKFSSAFAKDAKGEVTNAIGITLEKAKSGYAITKVLQPAALTWLQSSNRAFPIAIDPSVVVSGGIVSSETQFGGLQRKVAYVNSNWYAFYNDGTDVFYKKSSDGVSWGSAVDMDTGDADNYNPSISVSGNIITVFWIDDSSDAYQGRRINTASSDAQGTLCTSASQGTIGSTFTISVAAYSTTEAIVALSDTSTDTEVNMGKITGLDGSCSISGIGFANITFGTGIDSGGRPVLVPVSATKIGMVYQDTTALRYSEYNPVSNDWTLDDLQIAAVTDNVYSVTTDGTTVWILSVSGTTSTNLYSCCTTGFTTVNGDSDTGATGNDNVSDVDIYCMSSTDCKLIYTDDVDTNLPRLQFVDCDDATCSTGTTTTIDTDIGFPGDDAGASIYCVAADDCKVAYVDLQSTTSPDLRMVNCNDVTCTSFATGTVDSDTGTATMNFHTDIDCIGGSSDCKIMYNLEIAGTYYMEFVDCINTSCTTPNFFALYTSGGNENKVALTCPSATNCKVFAHDASNNKTVFMDCGNATCSSGNTFTDVLTSVTATTGHVPVAIACPSSTDCKLVFGDPTTADFYFVDCANETCTSTGRTITTFDADGGANASLDPSTSLYCVSSTDCKFTYVGNLTSGSEQVYFVDCNDAVCSSGYVVPLPNTRFKAAVACSATDDCKFVSIAGTSGTTPSFQFADCSTTNCYPTASTLTSPWTGQTNITTATLSYDSTNSDLVASILKDSTNQAYFKTSDAASISWGTEYSYGFTAGSLSDISSPMTGAGSSQMGVVTRQGTNFEFSTLPENPWIFVLSFPVLLYLLLRKRRKVLYHRVT